MNRYTHPQQPGATFVLLSSVITVCAQNLLPNPGFEAGTDRPAAWRLEGIGQWGTEARTGQRGATVEGKGADSSVWRSESLRFHPGGLYRLSFQARRDPAATGGCAVSGPGRVNRDFRFSETWQSYRFVFAVPDDGASDSVRLGQWHCKGRLHFDDATLVPVQVSHGEWRSASGTSGPLGEAESIEGGKYRFQPHFGWTGANYHRPLWRNRASFNSDRWVFGPGAEVVYRFALPGIRQTDARVTLSVNYHTAGALRLEASRDGRAWTPVSIFDGQRRNGSDAMPASLFPADEIFVRLATPEAPVNLQVNALAYEASLATAVPDVEGNTWFLAVEQSMPEIGVQLQSFDPTAAGNTVQAVFWVTNQSPQPLTLAASLTTTPGGGQKPASQTLAAGGAARFDLAARLVQPGSYRLEARFAQDTGRTLFAGAIEGNRSALLDPRPGYWLQQGGALELWWCESGWKIGREAYPLVPAGKVVPQPVRVSAARGEYEAVQVVLRPAQDTTLRSARVGSLRNAQGETAAIQTELAEVAYLHVTRPTDGSCERGWYPDPLPPLQTPLALRARRNQPLWLTFHVLRDAKPGDYRGELILTTDAGDTRVLLAVHVYDFELPRETHLRSAFGLGTGNINRYHKLTRREDQQAVYEKYLANFAAHRISPYSFFDYAPLDIRFTGEGANQRAQVEFSRFDQAAAKWLDEHHFNSFRLPLRGMGGGTFHSRHLGSLEGFQEGTPEHARLFQDYLGQIERHLRGRGWLDKAYTYWFDEPDPKDYQFVVDGMKRIRAAAPGLKRMLTEQPEPELQGHVEIWCGLTPEWTPEKVKARRDAGEEVWWYLCTGPKAPYVTIFIDHPGAEMRLWAWQSWQYGVQGILVWQSTYWTSSAAFPAPKLQDPWADPMGYVSGYDFKPGHVGYWGNGDGRFIYPPRRDPNTATEPNLDGPVNSVRWENLRDGLEDYEYFWLLQQAVERLAQKPGEAALVQQARALLTVPEEVSKDLTHFTTDPRHLLAHRDKLARMIEQLARR